jgi:hypothetical protein
MPTEEEMRTFLKNLYPHAPKWHRRVNRMPLSQVVAIYLKNRNNEPKVEKKNEDPDIPF